MIDFFQVSDKSRTSNDHHNQDPRGIGVNCVRFLPLLSAADRNQCRSRIPSFPCRPQILHGIWPIPAVQLQLANCTFNLRDPLPPFPFGGFL